MNPTEMLGGWPLADAELEPSSSTSVGLIMLGTDRVSHDDARAFLPSDIALYSTRIPMSVVATPEMLLAMETYLVDGADVLVRGGALDAIAFACTSGTVAIGLETVRARIGAVRPGVPLVTPVEAAAHALTVLGARRIALLVPYLEGPADLIHGFISARGFDVAKRASFGLDGDPEMNRVSARAITEAAAELASGVDRLDALFISCTGLKTSALIDTLEDRIGIPVVTSNQAQAWQLLRCAGRGDTFGGFGKLFTLSA